MDDMFVPPSVIASQVFSGESYTYHSPLPEMLQNDMTIPCCLGVDEAGRGPVLGPMVYACYYLPLTLHRSLLSDTHAFDDSKALTPTFRSHLMQQICTPSTALHQSSGWSTTSLSARSISSAMLRPAGRTYNLNAQAVDTTISLIQQVLDRGVNIQEIYIDTIGQPGPYQAKLERLFLGRGGVERIVVAKKADSLYPCVSAASVCAKVTRDVELELLSTAYHHHHTSSSHDDGGEEASSSSWGSGYPSDARCSNWLKANRDPVFGWGMECRFSWGTAKSLLEGDSSLGVPEGGCGVLWAEEEEEEGDDMKLMQFFGARGEEQRDELGEWFGQRVGEEVF